MIVDPSIVMARLKLMRALLVDLQDVGEVTAERLDRERLIRHAVERIVTQLVDLAVSINSHVAAATRGEAPETYRDSFRAAAEAGMISAELATEIAPVPDCGTS